jgi:hypothetical protein
MSERETNEEFAARMKLLIENRQKFPFEELCKYLGKCIAWAPDGSSILASADDYETLDRLLLEAGHDLSRCIFDCLDGESSI